MRLIDTHAHVNFKKFNEDVDRVILNSLNNNTGMIIVGTDYKSSRRAVDIANKYESGVYAAVGLHPVHLEDQTEEDEQGRIIFRGRAEEYSYDNYEKLASLEKVVAIGEIGLDYYHLKLSEDLNDKKKKQKEILWEQLRLSRDLNIPVILHCRNAHDDLYALLKDFYEEFKGQITKGEDWGVVHCFSGDEELAWKYFNLGLKISFTGMITFSSTADDLIRKMPIDKLMIETDCPFMTPEPYRGKRNEPVLVGLVAEKVAEIKNMKIEKIAEATTNNAVKFFNL